MTGTILSICRLFISAMFIGGPVSPSLADGSSVPYSEGGYVPDFVKIVRQYNASGELFRIEGTCKSACTLFLGIGNVCRTIWRVRRSDCGALRANTLNCSELRAENFVCSCTSSATSFDMTQ